MIVDPIHDTIKMIKHFFFHSFRIVNQYGKICCSVQFAFWFTSLSVNHVQKSLFKFYLVVSSLRKLPRLHSGKNLLASAGDAREAISIPGSERLPGGGNCSSLQYSCLENSMDRAVWQAATHGVTKSLTHLSMRAWTQALECFTKCIVKI